MLLALALLCCALLAAARAKKGCCATKRDARLDTPALACGILLASVGPQLGWAIKATYDNAIKLWPLYKHHAAAVDATFLSVLALAVALASLRDTLHAKRYSVSPVTL